MKTKAFFLLLASALLLLTGNVLTAAAEECLDCHGDNGRLDWKALGYKGDPMKDKSASRS